MTALEILNNKIIELKTADLSEIEKLQVSLDILEECEKVIEDEEQLLSYDFKNIIEILNDQDLNIENIEKIILEIKQIIEIKQIVNTVNIEYSEIQKSTLLQLKESIKKAKESIKKQLQTAPPKLENQDSTISNLEKLTDILTSKGKRKYYTKEMLDAFFETIDWSTLSEEEFDTLISEFYKTRNLQGKLEKEKENLEDVIALYREFLDKSEFKQNEEGKYIGVFASLICDHEEEITACIDLDNTREILQFFKDEGILTTFSIKRPSILKISLFADSQYVKKLYNKIKNEHPDDMDLYFEDETATLWICESSKTRRRPFVLKNRNKAKKKEESLYSSCHSISEEDFWNNVKLLNDNAQMFSDRYDVSNFGAHLRAKTLPKSELTYYQTLFKLIMTPSWSFSKNLELLKIFNMGEVYKIPVSILENGDIEDKIHLAIELGLLNPPMSLYYKELEKDISNNNAFQNISNKKKIANSSIRNYFTRNMSSLVKYDIQDFGFLAYKLETLGPVGFYNYFLSANKAGQSAYDEIKKDLKENFHSKEEEFLRQNFITDFDSPFIENYTEYDFIITEYNDRIKTQYNEEKEYFNSSIFEEELIKKLEEDYTVIDVISHDGNIIEVKNEFVYQFGDILISRYKVLHNAWILKNKYGSLNYNMLMASIVRHSYLSETSFEKIKESLMERNLVC